MRFRWLPILGVLIAVLCRPAIAQQESVHWHHDLESAKVVAKQTNRLVLVHFWTPSCGPCLALEQNVFNQPGVSSALEQQFVPVKLNADENSATAQLYGINRVPTDVVITPDGKMVGKLISPPTPAAYVAEVTGLSSKYATMSGQTFASAAAGAPVQPQLNAAYAGLKINTPPADPFGQRPGQPQVATPPAAPAATAVTAPVFNPASNGYSSASVATQPAAGSPAFAPNTARSVAPQTVNNPAAVPPPFAAVPPAAQPPITPIGAPALATAPAQAQNPYYGLKPSTPAPTQPPAAPPLTPGNPPMQFGATAGAAVPPMVPPAATAAGFPPSALPPNGLPDQRQLPPGAPPLGFDGYCPVSMRNSWKWIPGNPQWGVVHRGRTYWFASAEEQKQFWTDPDRYTPALSGMDPVLAVDHQQQVPGKREHSLDYDGLFYMFASEATLQQFTANPQRYAAGVRQAMGIPRGRLVR
jgi:protein disulfide-isomerase